MGERPAGLAEAKWLVSTAHVTRANGTIMIAHREKRGSELHPDSQRPAAMRYRIPASNVTLHFHQPRSRVCFLYGRSYGGRMSLRP